MTQGCRRLVGAALNLGAAFAASDLPDCYNRALWSNEMLRACGLETSLPHPLRAFGGRIVGTSGVSISMLRLISKPNRF